MSMVGFTRDPDRIRNNLEVMSDTSICCKQACRIVIPARYQERTLATLGSDIYILGVWAMVMDGNVYGISMTNAMMQIDPVSIQTIKMDEDEYLEFSFDPGSRVFVTMSLLKNKVVTYRIFDEFLSKGNVPWFIEYEDLAHLFQSAPYHAGKQIGGDPAIYEMIVATIAREHENRRVYFRHVAQDRKSQITMKPDIVPFRSVIYNATNTTAALLGSYASDGLVSALVHPATRTEKIEEILRR
jgi:hypothetical protein